MCTVQAELLRCFIIVFVVDRFKVPVRAISGFNFDYLAVCLVCIFLLGFFIWL